MKEAIKTEGLAALGPYSVAIKKNDTIYLSGQIAFDFETQELLGRDVKEQTSVVMKNIQLILSSVDYSLDDIVKTTIFLKNMSDFVTVNEVYASFLSAPYPARSTVEVARLPKDALIEIEVIAQK